MTGSPTPEGGNDRIADHRHDQCEVQASAEIGHRSEQERHERPADDRGAHDPRTLRGLFAQTFGAKAEDGREHQRIAEADEDQRPPGHGPAAHRRKRDQRNRPGGIGGQYLARAEGAQHKAAHETPDHRAAPIEGDQFARLLKTQSHHARIAEIGDHVAADCHFGADIGEDTERAELHPLVVQKQPQRALNPGIVRLGVIERGTE